MRGLIGNIYNSAIREVGIVKSSPVYWFCTLLLPIGVVIFFTSLLSEGVPTDMPCGVVDMDNTTITRNIIQKLDAFQTTRIYKHYPDPRQARLAIQRGEIYAYIYIPHGTTEEMISSRQPHITFCYSSVSMVAGSMMYRDLKTITQLTSASLGHAKLSALGKTEREIKAFIQPITIDVHALENPQTNYNVYLSTVMVAGVLIIFMSLLPGYSLGMEMKHREGKHFMKIAGNNVFAAVTGKMLPLMMTFTFIMTFFYWYIFGRLAFPHHCGALTMVAICLLTVTASLGLGVFMFGLIPLPRLSMSVCSLWAVLGMSLSGATFPVFAMNPVIEGLSWLFPLRHYYMCYQLCILNGYPIHDAYPYILSLVIFSALPILVLPNIKKAMSEYEYIP